MNRITSAVSLVVCLALPMWAVDSTAPFSQVPLPFYIYHGFHSPDNHFAPSGWMGDYGDIKFNDHFLDKAAKSRPVISVTYTARSAQGAGWAGIYWQHPPNN